MNGWALALHGGAGALARGDLSSAQDATYRASLAAATEVGAKILNAGKPAVDAVEIVCRALEDNPLFNAGKGAVFTAEGRNELDAAIMDGATLRAGAVAGITHTRNPIALARAIMDRSSHVMLICELAEVFGRGQGLEQVDPGYFFTKARWQALERFLTAEGRPVPPRPAQIDAAADAEDRLAYDEGVHGTVGVVARDKAGNVAAATSTGGMTGKRWGRVGDSPIIGAGTYAANKSCAISATGEGEYFIRLGAARTVCALVEIKGLPLQVALDEVVHNQLKALGGRGGAIAVNAAGEMAWSFNTGGMYRARAAEGQPLEVAVYGDEA